MYIPPIPPIHPMMLENMRKLQRLSAEIERLREAHTDLVRNMGRSSDVHTRLRELEIRIKRLEYRVDLISRNQVMINQTVVNLDKALSQFSEVVRKILISQAESLLQLREQLTSSLNEIKNTLISYLEEEKRKKQQKGENGNSQ